MNRGNTYSSWDPNLSISILDFLSNVKKTAKCWFWIGHTNPAGYGMIWDNARKRKVLAHRYSYERVNGAVGRGLIVRHKCDVTLCVNPEHLDIGTRSDNSQDASSRNRSGNQFSKHGTPRVFTNEEARAIREEYALSDMSQTKLARKYGVHQATISSIVLGKTHQGAGGPTGVTTRKQPHVIDDTQWSTIQRRLESGESQASIAREFGVTKACISVRLWRARQVVT
jgi:transposase-like protein